METLESARVAVLSRGLASAAADGLSTTPARETLTTPAVVDEGVVDVGAGVIVGAAVALVALAAVDEAAADEATAVSVGALPLPPNVNN